MNSIVIVMQEGISTNTDTNTNSSNTKNIILNINNEEAEVKTSIEATHHDGEMELNHDSIPHVVQSLPIIDSNNSTHTGIPFTTSNGM
jgi:hypothetical protein